MEIRMDPFLISDILSATHYVGVFVDKKGIKPRKIKAGEKIVLCEIANYKRCKFDLIDVLSSKSRKPIPATQYSTEKRTKEYELGILLRNHRPVSAVYLADISGMNYKTLLSYLHWLIKKGILDSIGLRINPCFFTHRKINEDDGDGQNFTQYHPRKKRKKHR